jgi:hypothetical protein
MVAIMIIITMFTRTAMITTIGTRIPTLTSTRMKRPPGAMRMRLSRRS